MADPSRNPAPEFTWSAHPAGERAGPAVGGIAVVAAIAGTVYATTASAGWGVLAAAVLIAALNRFYFRSRFLIDDEGITARFPLRTQRLGWHGVGRFVLDDNGGYLSTRCRASWLDAYRGVHVLFGRQRGVVIERIRAHLREEDDR